MGFIRSYSTGIALFVVIAAALVVQYSVPTVVGADGFLHGQMALQLSREGFLSVLPQAHFSWFSTRFSDKDFLYHLYLAPFVLAGSWSGVKLAAFLAAAGLYAFVVRLLSRYSRWHFLIPLSVLFILAPGFLRDTAEARPFVFAMFFTLAGVHCVIRKRVACIFIISLLYGMTHLSAWVIPAFAVIWSIYNWTEQGRTGRLAIFAALGGYGLSYFLHPNFPNNLFYAYLNGMLVPWYAIKTGVLELGAEFFPLSTRDLISRYPAIPFGAGMAVLSCMLFQIRMKRETVGWGLASLMFGVFGIVATRNVTHLYPVFIVWLGAFLSDAEIGFKSADRIKRERVFSVFLAISVLFIMWSGFQTLSVTSLMLRSESVYGRHFIRTAMFLKQNVPHGSRIFHANWSDSQYLIGLAPEYEYFVTLDPIYMYSYNRDLYQLYRQISFGQHEDPYTALKDIFGVQYGYAGKNYFGSLIAQIRQDRRFSIQDEDELGVVFYLEDAGSKSDR
jgi:hypothetical protein